MPSPKKHIEQDNCYIIETKLLFLTVLFLKKLCQNFLRGKILKVRVPKNNNEKNIRLLIKEDTG